VLAAGALIGGAIAAPQLARSVLVVSGRLEDVSAVAGVAGWLIVAFAALVVLEAALPDDRRAMRPTSG
jgi:hypothetical protein